VRGRKRGKKTESGGRVEREKDTTRKRKSRAGGEEAGEGDCEGKGRRREERGDARRGVGGGSRGVIGKHNLRTSMMSGVTRRTGLNECYRRFFFPKTNTENALTSFNAPRRSFSSLSVRPFLSLSLSLSLFLSLSLAPFGISL